MERNRNAKHAKSELVISLALFCLVAGSCMSNYTIWESSSTDKTIYMYFVKDRFVIQTHPQWNFADFRCTDLRVSPVHLTWYQSSQSSHCTQLTSLSWSWGWIQSTDAHVLYMKLSLSAESLLLEDFRVAFL